MQRRQFLALALAGALAPRLAPGAVPTDLKITRAVGFSLVSTRNRVVGKNSHLDVHGDHGTDRMLRLYTNTGQEGIGSLGNLKEADAAKLIGKNPFDFLDTAEFRFNGVGTATMAMWDLAGKARGEAVWKLLGAHGRDRVPVYDGSIYFQDLLPEHAGRWRDRFKEELDMGLKRGHKAFKIKIGRGFKWMPRAEGDARDVEVVKLIRAHLGQDAVIGVDANNGYDLAGTKKLFDQIGGEAIDWAEEMFPEEIVQCLEFKKYLQEKNYFTLLADGETQGELIAMRPFVDAKAIDILQCDMNRFGVDGIMAMATMGETNQVQIAPHNWGSYVGFYQIAQIGKAVINFYRAEQDPLENKVLIADGYKVENGAVTVPDVPGNGLKIDDKYFASDVKVIFDVKA